MLKFFNQTRIISQAAKVPTPPPKTPEATKVGLSSANKGFDSGFAHLEHHS